MFTYILYFVLTKRRAKFFCNRLGANFFWQPHFQKQVYIFFGLNLHLSIIIIQNRQSLHLRFKSFYSKFKCVNVNIRISNFQISEHFSPWSVFRWWRILTAIFRTLWCLSENIYSQVAQLKCHQIWKKITISFKISGLNAKFMPNAWKLETMTHKPSLKGCSLNRDFTSTFILFYLNLTIWFSCLKTWGIVSWVHMFGGFFNFKKKRNKW